ncbi:MAG: HEPN domain-containing protein [Chloroflexota bacterium]
MNIDKRILTRFKELAETIDHNSPFSHDEIIDTRAFTAWGVSAHSLISRVFGTNSIHFSEFNNAFKTIRDHDYEVYDDYIDVCLGAFQSAYHDFQNGYLFDVRTLVNAELGDTILEQAKSLLKGNYKDIACVVAGIALELGLKDLCRQQGVTYTGKTKLEDLNTNLRKKDIYNESMRKQITAWIALRNYAAHGEWDEYTHADVKYLINGVERFLGEYLSKTI